MPRFRLAALPLSYAGDGKAGLGRVFDEGGRARPVSLDLAAADRDDSVARGLLQEVEQRADERLAGDRLRLERDRVVDGGLRAEGRGDSAGGSGASELQMGLLITL